MAWREESDRWLDVLGHGYGHEMVDDDHRELIACLRFLRGIVLLSGYKSNIYAEALVGWNRVTKETLDNGRNRQTEVVWMNPACVAGARQPDLFDRLIS